MLNIGDQISQGARNVRQRMSGRAKNDGKGTYASVPNVETMDEPIVVGTFAKPEEHDAASVLQGY